MDTPDKKIPDQSFWNAHWQEGRTGWDIGYASPAITEYMDQYANKDAAIFIPGCGNAYEAEYLVKKGFTNITLVDIAPKAVENLQAKFKEIPAVRVICQDFFGHQGHYDLMLEQTFFCAIPPKRRNDYVDKAFDLLNQKGKLAGVLFNRPFEREGPPFGGNKKEYQQLFERRFVIEKMETCYNSIPSRADHEVFIEMKPAYLNQ